MTLFSSSSDAEVVRACAESHDSAAWEEFVARFQRPIRLSLLRIAAQWAESPAKVLDDLTQETYFKLCADRCRLLLEFAREHPEEVSGYVKVIAVNVARDYFKSAHSIKRGAGHTKEGLENVDPKAEEDRFGGPRAMERDILLKQIDECLSCCATGPEGERDRSIFWLYYRQGLSAKAISSLPGIGLSAKGVESALLRLTRQVRAQMVAPGPHSTENPEDGKKGFRLSESY